MLQPFSFFSASSRYTRWLQRIGLFAIAFISSAGSYGQTTDDGSISGRVFSSRSGGNLERVRVTVEGRQNETFTDAAGRFQLGNVPVGPARVKVFRTGLIEQTVTAHVIAGKDVSIDIEMSGYDAAGRTDPAVVNLDRFEVKTSREMDGAAIAINEQRFAPNMRNVINAGEFGPTDEGNIGELLRFVPGVTIFTSVGNAYSASINGVPDAYVPVTVRGFNLASPQEETSRMTMLQNMSTNNLSRIEVVYSPTPESPGMALAGSVNVVPQSSFERSKPSFTSSAFIMMRSDDRSFHKTPGPGKDPSRKVHPGMSFSYIAPVNDRFGFTLSGGTSTQYLRAEYLGTTWVGVGAASNGTTLPDTTPDRPYLTGYSNSSSNTETSRYSLGASIDYKLSARDRISFSLQYVLHTAQYNEKALAFATGGVLPDFTPTSTHGMTGSGNISVTNNDYLRTNPGITPTLVYWHSGPIWKAEAGIGYSKGTTVVSNFSEGYFFNSLARRTGLTVSFDGITYLRPSTITVTDGATGAPVDPYRLDNYLISSVRSHSLDIQGRKNMVQDTQRSAYANLGREFSWRVPVAVKAGLDVRETIRDLRVGGQSTLNFVGADGRATTTPVNSDDFAGVVLDPLNSQRAPGYGLPPIQWVSNSRLFDLYRTNPTYFRLDEATTYRSNATTSKFADEIISSVYIRGDVHFFDRRLKIVGGVRAEQTNVKAEGPLTDTTRNYQRDANGKVILGSNGSPIPITTDPLGIAKLTVIERGLKINKEYLRLFPSLNSSYTFRDNLIVRGAYYHSVGRPNFNQYAGGVTLPDTEAVNPATQRITVNNAGIKAWSAKTTKVMLEYYFEKVGVVSVSAFRRNFENFFGTAVFRATPEFLSLYGLDPNIYGNYDVSTQYNVPTGVRMEGIDLNYKQSLTMLPYWARGVQVFANVSALRATGPETANFAGYVPRTYNAGFTLSRQKFSLRVNSSYRGRNRSTLVATGRSIAPNTFRWGARQLYLGASAEYALFKRVSVYADFHNDVMLDTEIANPLTPEHAQLSGRQEYGGLWTFGVKSSF